MVLHQFVQRAAPSIREYELPARTACNEALFKQCGHDGRGGPISVSLDVQKHRTFRGREAVRSHLVCHGGPFINPDP